MSADKQDQTPVTGDALPAGYKEVPWPQKGRLVFGPWCLLGAWPALFGVVEKAEEQKQENR